ncbi:unnamed protein product [Nippostrongylus brasiliensis]|uniref:Flavin_Reduct domain-containing protein n=1 Tax=Nippostrongylus brasiliensis TaxID=27835 RepID=A0A0N4YZQ9_NIPBR|nr:unnamed protein product [Nippostrongylus brasiliensis]
MKLAHNVATRGVSSTVTTLKHSQSSFPYLSIRGYLEKSNVVGLTNNVSHGECISLDKVGVDEWKFGDLYSLKCTGMFVDFADVNKAGLFKV